MKLLFYFMRDNGKDGTFFDVVEREATPVLQGDRIAGYEFDQVSGYGRPFSYIHNTVVGTVNENWPFVMLALKEDEKTSAEGIWKSYFTTEIAKRQVAIDKLQKQKEFVLSSEIFEKSEDVER